VARGKSSDLSELFEIKVRPQSSPLDAIEDYLRRMAQQEYLEAQLAKLRQIRARAEVEARKAERELRKLEGDDEEEEGPRRGAATVTPEELQVAQILAELPEEKRGEVIRYLALIKSMEARNPSASAIALATLLAGLRESSREDTGPWEVAKTLIDKLVDITSEKRRGESSSLSDELAKEYLDLLKNVALNRPDSIEEVKKWLSFIKEFGMLGYPASVDPRVLVELEKLKLKKWALRERLKLKRKELELRKRELMRREKRRRELLSRIASSVVSALMEPEEEELREENRGGSGGAQKGVPQGYIMIRCPKCGTENVVPKDAEHMTCVGCGTRYKIRRRSAGQQQRASQTHEAQPPSQREGVAEREGGSVEAGHEAGAGTVGGGARAVSY